MFFADSNVQAPATSTTSSSNPTPPVVTVRKYFPETWIWDLVPVSKSGVMIANKTTPDSITTWQADAFCTSAVGFGVAQTELTTFQPFFVGLTLPISIIRGEAFTLKATVFNYLQSCMMINVTLANSQQFLVEPCVDCCYTRCLCVDDSWTFSWNVTPLVLGEVTISVTAEAVQSTTRCGQSKVIVPQAGHIDTVIETLLVQPEGIKQFNTTNLLLCPSGVLEETVSLNLPAVYVQGSAIASVSVLGDLMGQALQNLASLLGMPYGCGEQNMMLFAPDIYILEYLQSTNQLTPATLSTAVSYLVSGYQRELNYKHTDGSYSAFGMSDPSGNTWLTAFVLKSFRSAMQYIFIDQGVLDQAKTWLGQQQQTSGCFNSVGQLIHTDLEGGVNDQATLSAYVVAALLETNYTTADPVVKAGLQCLRNTFSQVNGTYTKALLFYAFTLAGDQAMRNTLITQLDSLAVIAGGGRHWSVVIDGSVSDSVGVETTAYVLLALMSGPQISGFDLGYSSSIVHWLSQQQNTFGGFVSTQDTVVALQALAKYSLATYSPAGSVNLTLTSPSALIYTFNISQSNRLLYQETQLKDVSGSYSVKAEGKGCVYIQFTLSYNIPPPPEQSSFTVSATVSGDCTIPSPTLKLTISITYNGQGQTNMVIINIKPVSGFTVDQMSVLLLNTSNVNQTSDGAVKRVEQDEEGYINIYLDPLDSGDEKLYILSMVQEQLVQNLKPGVIQVYDYYSISDRAAMNYVIPCAEN